MRHQPTAPLRRLASLGAAALLGALVAGQAQAQAQVSWASSAVNLSGSVPAALGAPDASTVGSSLLLGQFNQTVAYATLPAVLGMSTAQFLGYDLIAWEANGGSPAPAGGFESTSLTVQTALGSASTIYNGVNGSSLNPSLSLLSGSISGAAYNALFGTNVGAQTVWSYLLIDVPASLGPVDASLQVTFSPAGTIPGFGEGTPDLDAMGLISVVPEPGTWGLMALGVAALLVRRRLAA